MQITRIPHYLKRSYELGPRYTFRVVSQRATNVFLNRYMRYRAKTGLAGSSWNMIAEHFDNRSFSDFFTQKQKHAFLNHDFYDRERADVDSLIKQADRFVHNCFDLLGSEEQCFTKIPWHTDFRLAHQNPKFKNSDQSCFNAKAFYKDIVVQTGLTDRLVKDIKIPWELSRLQHLYVLGLAFEQTKDQKYANAFKEQVSDWLNENSYLLGPNWVCPMDVGLRAVNLIWAFHFFKNAQDIDKKFWESFVCSLYDHMTYLENNWELYEITSNHYFSNLVGYFYLTWFFNHLENMKQKQEWVYQEILRECEKQIFDEGTDFEGSTRYHKLMTELVFHSYFLAQELKLPISEFFVSKMRSMFSFIDWATPWQGELIKIGDDDSGKVLFYGVTNELIDKYKNKSTETKMHFAQFGLSVLKTKKLHVTLRHHLFSKSQPSGHFHNDMNSITVAINGIDLFVDPGSYVYTPSSEWRNLFRSVAVHNSCSIKDIEPVMFDDRSLFTLGISEQSTSSLFVSAHDLYGVRFERTIIFDDQDSAFTIQDTWSYLPKDTELTGFWNFTLASDIVPVLREDAWHLMHNNRVLAILKSPNLLFQTISGWTAPCYGKKVATRRLIAERALSDDPIILSVTVPVNMLV